MMKTDVQHFPAPHQQWWYLCPVNSGYIPYQKKRNAAPHLGLLLALHIRIR